MEDHREFAPAGVGEQRCLVEGDADGLADGHRVAAVEYLAAITRAPEAGASIGAPAAAFGSAFGKVCADLVESATGLGTLVQSSAELYGATETAADRRFGGMVPR